MLKHQRWHIFHALGFIKAKSETVAHNDYARLLLRRAKLYRALYEKACSAAG